MFSLSQFFSRFRAPMNAANAWQAAGGEFIHPYWLFASPVHLLLGRDSYFMHNEAPIALSDVETNLLLADLNAHFVQEGWHFYMRNATWFIGLNASPNITTIPLKEVIGKDVSPYLPMGDGALAWAKLQNELQMLLFSHPVNTAREQAGRLPVNSLWFYGEAR